MFHDRLLLSRCFQGFILPGLECCSAVWCSAADTHLKLLDRAVSGALFLTGSPVLFECGIAHRRSLTVLCMLYKIRCNPLHPRNGALPRPFVPVQATRGVLLAHWHTYAPPRCRTSQYSRSFIPISVSLLLTRIRWCGTGGFQEHSQCLFIGLSCSIPTIVFYSFSFLFFLSIGWYCGAGVFGLRGCISLSLSCALPTPF